MNVNGITPKHSYNPQTGSIANLNSGPFPYERRFRPPFAYKTQAARPIKPPSAPAQAGAIILSTPADELLVLFAEAEAEPVVGVGAAVVGPLVEKTAVVSELVAAAMPLPQAE